MKVLLLNYTAKQVEQRLENIRKQSLRLLMMMVRDEFLPEDFLISDVMIRL